MKSYIKIALFTVFSFSVSACADQQTKAENDLQSNSTNPLTNTQDNFVDDSMTRTGLIESKELITLYPKFKQQYDQFEPEAKDIKHFSLLKEMDIVVFFGLWCHDSQREVPRLLKLIEQSGNQFKTIKLVALNTDKEMLDEYSSQFKVKYTPTIFMLKNGQILAKVVEKPQNTLAQDLLRQILH
jgi:thiol-disulfide isomerase/thioredoxin